MRSRAVACSWCSPAPAICAGQPLKQYTTVYLDQDERATLQANETTEFLHYGLPDLSDMTISSAETMQAAE